LVNFDQFSEAKVSILILIAHAQVTNVAGERGYELRLLMPATLVVLLVAVWLGAIAILVSVDRDDKFLWIPVLCAVAGVFSSILPLAISAKVAVVANAATLILFIVSLKVLTPKHRRTVALTHKTSRSIRRHYEASQNMDSSLLLN
jgi:hypothetical protein